MMNKILKNRSQDTNKEMEFKNITFVDHCYFFQETVS